MLRLVFAATALILVAGWDVQSANAQQGPPQTCSEVKYRCVSRCGRVLKHSRGRALVDPCKAKCEQLHEYCMRTGDWVGRIKRTGLKRI